MQGLDSVRLLTRGDPLNMRNVMRRVSPTVLQQAIIWEEIETQTTYAQIEKCETFDFAQMSYLGGLDYPDKHIVASLLEELAQFARGWAAVGILADLPEQSPLFEGFRLAGFTIWARQSIYTFPRTSTGDNDSDTVWRDYQPADRPALIRLHKKHVPAVSHPMAPLNRWSEMGLVALSAEKKYLGYADINVGPRGIWVQPLIDCHANNADLLSRLSAAVANPANRPVYLCARSYQPQLADFAERSGYEKVDSQILLVKHLVQREKVEQRELKRIFESSKVEGSVPLSQVRNKST